MSIVLSAAEIEELTGYKAPTMQLGVLRARGFERSWIGRHGNVVLPRAHFEAVQAGTYHQAPEPEPDYSGMFKPPSVHWRQRPEHQERLRREREADLAETARAAEVARLSAAQAAVCVAEMARTRPERRATLVRHHSAKRRVATLKRTPPWANQDAIKAIYAEALRLKRETGIEHHVDHIIPLQGELVSGLHVENNLQVLPWRENVMKRNHFEVDA